MGIAQQQSRVTYEQNISLTPYQAGNNTATNPTGLPTYPRDKEDPYEFNPPVNNTNQRNTDVILSVPPPTANSSFRFNGKPLSLLSRLTALPDEEIQKITDAHLNITGKQIQGVNNGAYMATMIGASLIILPIFFICCDWWKRCTLAAYDVPISVYEGFSKLLRGSSLRSLDITVNDSAFDALKASILFQGLSSSRISFFSFRNNAGDYDYVSNEYSNF